MINKIQEIFRLYYETNKLPKSSVKREAVNDIMNCGTELMGQPITCICKDCGYSYTINRSCGNRNCPHCQSIKQAKWVQARYNELMNVPYFHGVFTVPCELNPYFLIDPTFCYNLLLNCASKAISHLSVRTEGFNAKIGYIEVLHSWGSTLEFHPHVHVIIPGVGIDENNQVIVSKKDYLMPVKTLMSLFREYFLEGLGERIPDELHSELSKKKWNVFLKSVDCKPQYVIDYLGRYTSRVAISNSRIVSYDKKTVTFTYKDYKNDSQIREMTLSTKEFVRRYLMHVLPKGFSKIRFCGLLCTRFKRRNICYIRCMLRGRGGGRVRIPIHHTRQCTCPSCNSTNLVRLFNFTPPKQKQFIMLCKPII